MDKNTLDGEGLGEVREKLADNFLKNNVRGKEPPRITIIGYEYKKYNEYQIAFTVNCSTMNIGLDSIDVRFCDDTQEFRVLKTGAIAELDRIISNFYKNEEELNELRFIADKIGDWVSFDGCPRDTDPAYQCQACLDAKQAGEDAFGATRCDQSDEAMGHCWVGYYRWLYRQQENNNKVIRG